MIFFAETAVRDSLTRQTMTAIAPATELIKDITLRENKVIKRNRLKRWRANTVDLRARPGALPRTHWFVL